MIGIWWADPGVSTGLAWGIFNERAPTVKVAMSYRLSSGSATIYKVTEKGYETEDIHHQVEEMFKSWVAFKRHCVQSSLLDPDQVVCGIEDFILTAGSHSPGVEGIFPAFLVGGFEAYRLASYAAHRPRNMRHYTPLTRQAAGKGMKYNKRQILEKWGAWVVGRQHERAAFSHIGAYLMDRIS